MTSEGLADAAKELANKKRSEAVRRRLKESPFPKPCFPLNFHPGWVYLLLHEDSGLHKIGASRKLQTRLTELSRAHGKCVLLHAIVTNNMRRLEWESQTRFLQAHWVGEWFSLSQSQVAAFRSVSVVDYLGIKKPSWLV